MVIKNHCGTTTYCDAVGNDKMVDLSCGDIERVLRTSPMQLTEQERETVKNYLNILEFKRAYIAGNYHLFVVMSDGREIDLGNVRGLPGATPRVGENGNWFVDGVDTGTPARGPRGPVPNVGENGNWFVDGVDTGVLSGKPSVGDTIETMRDDLGLGWVACDGSRLSPEDHPKLYDKLPYNTEWRVFDRPSDYNRVRPTRRPGEWVFLKFGNASMLAASAKVYNASTETWTNVSCPSVPTDYSYGIFGLTWDGSRYIMGVMEDSASADYIGTMYLFTSTDLKNWTQKYSFKNSANYMQGYDLTSDGENTIVMEYGTTHVSPSNHYAVYFVNREMTNHTRQISNSVNISGVSLVPAPDGYWAYIFPVESGDGNYDAVLFYKGNTYIIGSYKSSNGALAFFSDRYVMTVGGVRTSGNTFGAPYSVVADLKTGTSKTATWDSLTGLYSAFMNYCEYDKTNREWLFIIKTLKTEYYAAYISEDADPSVASSYRVVRIEALPEREYNDQMSPDRAVIHNNLIRDPNLKYLLSHEDGGIRRYIYEGVDGAQSDALPSPNLYATDPNAVHYYRDDKTEEQKEQARENIGAASKSMVDDTTKTVYSIGIDNGIIYLEEV